MNAHERALLAHWRRSAARWSAVLPAIRRKTGLRIWNPAAYGMPVYERYAERHLPTKPGALAMLGLNPGKYGMAQTGLPFTDAWTAKRALDIGFELEAPALAPKTLRPYLRPTRRERSCQSVYAFLELAYGSAEAGLRDVWFPVPCTLLFLDETGENVTPADARLARLAEVADTRRDVIRDALATARPRGVVLLGKDVAKAGLDLAHDAVGASRTIVLDHPVARGPGRRGPTWWAKEAQTRLARAGLLKGR